MKSELLRERLKAMKGAPLYECPECHTVVLIVGGQNLPSYTCRMCGHLFAPAKARYSKDRSAPQQLLPKAA